MGKKGRRRRKGAEVEADLASPVVHGSPLAQPEDPDHVPDDPNEVLIPGISVKTPKRATEKPTLAADIARRAQNRIGLSEHQRRELEVLVYDLVSHRDQLIEQQRKRIEYLERDRPPKKMGRPKK